MTEPQIATASGGIVLPTRNAPKATTDVSPPPSEDALAGREEILGSPEVAKMREVVTILDAHAATFQERIKALEADGDLSREGRQRKIDAVKAERDARLAAIVGDYDKAETSLLNRYTHVDSEPLPIQLSDAARIQVALAKLDRLSPESGIRLMQRYVDAKDHVVVQELLDVFADVSERRSDYVDYLNNVPLSSNPIRDIVNHGRLLLTGKTNYAARFAREILPKARGELDLVVDTIKDEGAWTGSTVQRAEGSEDRRALTWLAVPKSE